MKAKYVKPALVMERFEMTQSIAAGCGADPNSTLGRGNHYDKYTCGWDLGSSVIWTEENSACSFKWVEDGEINGICYNNPEGGQNIFGS